MSGLFYNIVFDDEFDLATWCELYKTTKDVFDVIDMDDEGKYHATFSAECVPRYHKEVCKQVKAEMEVSGKYGKIGDGRIKTPTSAKHKDRAKAGRGQTADELFILR